MVSIKSLVKEVVRKNMSKARGDMRGNQVRCENLKAPGEFVCFAGNGDG